MMDFERKLPQIVEWIEKWCHINSHSYNLHGLEKMADALIEAFSPLADTSEVIALKPIERFNATGTVHTQSIGSLLSFKKRPQAKTQILFCGHYDTVFPENFPVVVVGEEKIMGPGAADMKGGIALILAILQVFETSEYAQNIGWEVILTPDEEIGSPSSAEYLKERAPHFNYGLVFEPGLADGAIATARPASCVYELIIQGQAAHIGRDPKSGKSAIVAAADLVTKLQTLLDIDAHKLFNAGIIRGGTAVNTIPALTKIDINMRAPTDNDLQEMIKKGKAFSHDVEKTHGVSIQWEQFTHRPEKTLTKELEDMIALYKKCGKNLTFHPVGGVCDGNILASAGLPNLDTLGPIGHHLHSHDEYLEYPSLVERGKLTLEFLVSLARK